MTDWTPEAVRGLIARRGITYADLARTCRVSEATARHWSNGTRNVPGPATVLLDLIDAGRLKVAREHRTRSRD